MAATSTRSSRRYRYLLWLLLAAGCLPALAGGLPGVEDPSRARTNYMLNCQGCHGPSGEGSRIARVPRMQGFAGYFLRVDGGREFMVQVPGSANAALSDAALAELLNWLLPTISGDEMPAGFIPYDAAEVGRLRRTPAIDVAERRAALVAALARDGVSIPAAAAAPYP